MAQSILIIVWHLLTNPAARCQDLGPGWHARHQLEAPGYDVIITLREEAA